MNPVVSITSSRSPKVAFINNKIGASDAVDKTMPFSVDHIGVSMKPSKDTVANKVRINMVRERLVGR